MTVGIGFSLQSRYDMPISQVIARLAQHGFYAVSPVWSPDLDLATIASAVKANNMIIQSLHATYTDIFLLWQSESARGIAASENIIRSLDDCAEFGIPILVMHGWSGFDYSFSENSLDFALFDKLVEHAKALGVSIAFENLEGEEFLCALLERYSNCANVGYCWDSGHERCYLPKTDFIEKFAGRLIMTHLHDNYGLRDENGTPTGYDDLHLLPYDGVIDWDAQLKRLSSAAPQTILNFELKKVLPVASPSDLLYADLPLEDFIAKAGKIARNIADKYEENLK